MFGAWGCFLCCCCLFCCCCFVVVVLFRAGGGGLMLLEFICNNLELFLRIRILNRLVD